jgi:membrane-bound lytic murein transglycosylase A
MRKPDFWVVLLAALLTSGCTAPFFLPPHLPDDRLVTAYSSSTMILVNRPYSEIIKGDDLPRDSLMRAIEQSKRYLSRVPFDTRFTYGNLVYSATEMDASLTLFRELLLRDNDYHRMIADLEEQFYLFASAANEGDQVLVTGYYEPVFEGSLSYSPEYPIPVYRLPPDLQVLQLGRFRDSLKDRTIVFRLDNDRILPYYTREEIMEYKVLAGRDLEIAWMKDPVDLFFMQIQGSGTLRLPDGERVRLSYAGANGQPYLSIGRLLVAESRLTLEETSMQTIRHYLTTYPDDVKRVLYHNRSYVFFALEPIDEHPRGNLNVPLTPLRSIATDSLLFPKAGIAYLSADYPVFDEQWQQQGTQPFTRFVITQDTGGAIKGPGRVDLFWGHGRLAEESAGAQRSHGRLYFLVAKKEWLTGRVDDMLR